MSLISRFGNSFVLSFQNYRLVHHVRCSTCYKCFWNCKSFGTFSSLEVSNRNKLLRNKISFDNPQNISVRSLAKGKDKKKEKKTDRPKVILDEDEMEQVLRFEDLKMEIDTLIEDFKEDLKVNYNVKLNPRVIESLEINYEGAKVTLGDIVNIARKQNDLIINLSATPGAVKPAIIAIQESGLNLNPQCDGNIIYVKMPRVTTEHRQALIKSVQSYGQKIKDRIKDRNFHKKFFEKDFKKLSQDLVNDAQANLLYYVKQKCSEIDDIVKQKEESLKSN